MKPLAMRGSLALIFLTAGCAQKTAPAVKTSVHDAVPQQTASAAGAQAGIAGMPRVLPVVHTAGASLNIEAPRWGAGNRTVDFDLTYSGSDPSVDCGYQMYDSAGNPVGPSGSFGLRSGEKTTESLSVSPDVFVIKLTLPR